MSVQSIQLCSARKFVFTPHIIGSQGESAITKVTFTFHDAIMTLKQSYANGRPGKLRLEPHYDSSVTYLRE